MDRLISEQKVLEAFRKYQGSISDFYKAIKAIPSAEPKTGHWIKIDDFFMAKCSECGEIVDSRNISKYPYCHCGAKMVEPQERSEE